MRIRNRSLILPFVFAVLCAISVLATAIRPANLREILSPRSTARKHMSSPMAPNTYQPRPAEADSLVFADHLVRDHSKTDRYLLPLRANGRRSFLKRGNAADGESGRLVEPTGTRSETHVTEDGHTIVPGVPVRTSSLDQGADACPATIIPATPFADSGSTTGLQNDFTFSCGTCNAHPDVIYRFTPENTGTYVLHFTAAFDNMVFVLRAGGECPGDTERLCSGVSEEFGPTEFPLALEAGTDYYIIIDGCSYVPVENYAFELTGPVACHPDFNLVAPGTVSGNTCFAGDDCPVLASEDQMIRLVIPHTGEWTFSFCDGQGWDAQAYLMNLCCGPVLNFWWSTCATESGRWYNRPVLYGQMLLAGEYFVAVEGQSGECGPWTLEVTEHTCPQRPPNDACESAVPEPLPAVFTGDNTCATNDCPEWEWLGGEVWHAFVLDSAADVCVDYCGTSSGLNTIAAWLVQGCPCDTIVFSDYWDYAPCEGEYVIRVFYPGLASGTYYLPIIGDDYYNHGPYRISVHASSPCDVSGLPTDVIECAETPGPDHADNDCNGGCNVTPPAFQDIALSDTVLGRCFTYVGPNGWNYRDTDWYRFSLAETSAVSVQLDAEFPAFCAILNSSDCDQLYAYGRAASYERCRLLSFATECIPPGTYTLFVAPCIFSGLPDPLNYRVRLSTSPCSMCVVAEQPGDIPEGEPDCYPEYDDHYNVGCNGWPEVYTDMAVGQTIYGNGGVYRHSWDTDSTWYRDTDWFRFELDQPGALSWTVEAEFPALVAICRYCDDEFDGAYVVADIPPCQTMTLRTTNCLPPGTYYTYVATSDWGPYPCGSHYRGTLRCEPCSECDTNMVRPQDGIEGEPVCGAYYIDEYNGGCNSDPPAFGPTLSCGQIMVGTSGTFYNDLGSFRDTDWFPFCVVGTRSIVVNWCVFAQFPPMITILRAGPCDSLATVTDIVTGNACDTVCTMNAIPPGDYWLFVAPADFYTSPCGSQYRAWITCAPCVPDTVRDLTIGKSEHCIMLRWTPRRDFVGTYNVYTSADYAAWSLLRGNLAPVVGRTTFADSSALADRRYYLVTGTCP